MKAWLSFAIMSLAGARPTHAAPQIAAAAEQDIRDIYGPLPLAEPFNWPLLLIVAGGVAALAALALFLRRKHAGSRTADAVPPHTRALRELDRARRHLDEGRHLRYADDIAQILRGYIEERFAIDATSRTTSELVCALRRHSGGTVSPLAAFADQLEEWLRRCDMAKYAGETGGRPQLEEMDGQVRRFIEATAREEK